VLYSGSQNTPCREQNLNPYGSTTYRQTRAVPQRLPPSAVVVCRVPIEKQIKMDELEKQNILKSITLEGASLSENKTRHLILGSRHNLNHIAGISSGSLKIYPSISNKFKLILSQPQSLSVLSPFEIRCVFCKRVISYPCWYYSIKYAVNHFHYFVCFDSESPNKPSTRCYRRDI